VNANPLLDVGELGGFDDSGAMLSWITDVGEFGKYFYYAGWIWASPFRSEMRLALRS